MKEIFVTSLYDAVVDSLKVLPILFLSYLLVSFLSHDHTHKFSKLLLKKNKTGVLFGAFLGCVPQCGFSSVIADFYSRKSVTLGTLIAVFVATSDEAIPIMISNPERIVDLLILIAIKVVYAIFWGYLIDLCLTGFSKLKAKRLQKCQNSKNDEIFAKNGKKTEKNMQNCENIAEFQISGDEKTAIKQQEKNLHQNEKMGENECDANHEEHHCEGEHLHTHQHSCGHIHTDSCDDECGHENGACCVNNVFLDAFLHTFSILIYIFVATFVLNFIISTVTAYGGADAVQNLFGANVYLQIFLASLIGLIPNCASSVLLVELYVGTGAAGQILSFPALVAGLTAGAGVGLVILWSKNRKKPLQNLLIVLLQYFIGVVSGLFLTIFI